ncbi:MAG: hypothetical protein ACYTG0_34190 [Planctomycetota bacterium]|jgi:hypothetical protein
MRMTSLGLTITLAALTWGVGKAQPPSPETLPSPIATRQTVFSIPFQVAPPEGTDRDPTEIQLYVSMDRGARWLLSNRVAPTKTHFVFRAPTDGEYWFLIRTKDRLGQLRPRQADRPGLRVLVDTTPPELELEARKGEAGQIAVAWRATDPHLDIETLKIEYRSSARRGWQPVAVDRRNVQSLGLTRSGEVNWWPDSAGMVEIRAEAADTAGNPALRHAVIKLGAAATATPRPGASPSVDPQGTPQADGFPWRASSDDPAATRREALPPNVAQTPQPSPDPEIPFARDTEGIAGEAGRGIDPRSAVAPSSVPWPENVDGESLAVERRPWSPPAPTEGMMDPVAGAISPVDAVAANANPAVRNQFPGAQKKAVDFTRYGLPPGEQPQMIAAKVFEIEYYVDSVGPSGVGRVEVWGTRDGGRTWASFGLDSDNRTPVVVSVPEEGVYGFRFAVQNGVGLGGERPQPGDTPDAWVGVDLTEPTVRILSVEQAAGEKAGQLNIFWEADDLKLAPRPVSLRFATGPTGPWNLIAADLDNSGRYTWAVRPPVPEQVYISLEVRDEAGNAGMHVTPKPFVVDPLRPVARVRNVRPVVDSARVPSRQGYRW